MATDKETYQVYVDAIVDNPGAAPFELVPVIRNRLKEVCRINYVKRKTVVSRLHRILEKQKQFGSTALRYQGSKATVNTHKNVDIGCAFYTEQNYSQCSDEQKLHLDAELAEAIGIRHQSSSWYNYRHTVFSRLYPDEKAADDDDDNVAVCHICKGDSVEWLAPTFNCSQCNNAAHPHCDAMLKYSIPADFAAVDHRDVGNIRNNCVAMIESNFICSQCADAKWTKLHRPYIDHEGNEIHTVFVDYRQQKHIKVREYAADRNLIASHCYQTHRKTANVEFEKVRINNYKYDKAKMRQSIEEYQRHTNDENASVPEIKAYIYLFKDSGVPSGGCTAEDTLTIKELLWLKDRLKFMHYQSKNKYIPAFVRKKHAADWKIGNHKDDNWRRLKLYFNYWYEYIGTRVSLHKHRLDKHELDVYEFLKLRNQAVWKNMFDPDMLQMNGYKDHRGIVNHPDEIAWFPEPVHSTRIGGWAKLHFGMCGHHGASRSPLLKDLYIKLVDGGMFRMSGIIQLMYKHGIPYGKQWVANQTITVLMRKVNEHSLNVQLPKR